MAEPQTKQPEQVEQVSDPVSAPATVPATTPATAPAATPATTPITTLKGEPETVSKTSPAPASLPTPPSVETPLSDGPDDFQGDIAVDDTLPTAEDLKKCEDLLVLDSSGESRPFKSLYSAEDIAPRQLIIFIRHFFCGNCQEFLRSLSAAIKPEELLSTPTPTFITIIGCGRPELISMYTKETSCPFPIYADPTRKLYDILGMTRTFEPGSKRPEYMKTNMFVSAVTSIIQGVRSGSGALKGGDFKQVGGEFLFDKGKLVWCHRMKNTRDHKEISELRQLIGLGDVDSSKIQSKKGWSAISKRAASIDKKSVKGSEKKVEEVKQVKDIKDVKDVNEVKETKQDKETVAAPATTAEVDVKQAKAAS